MTGVIGHNAVAQIDIDSIPPDVLRLKLALPKLADGRIDYHASAEAPVLNCYVRYGGKILLVKRGDKVGWLKNRWHVIAGFLDDEKTLREKALEELYEETRIPADAVESITALRRVVHADEHKRWIVYAVVIELARIPHVVLDWEHSEHAWIAPAEAKEYCLLPPVERAILSL